MGIKSQKDFFSGVMFMAVGAAFAIGVTGVGFVVVAGADSGGAGVAIAKTAATHYKIGTGARMGPGYFPLLLGVLLAVLGAVIAFKAMVVETVDGDKIGSFAWKPLFFIIAANLVFGVLLGGLPSIKFPAFGLIVAIYALTFIAAHAGEEFKFKEVAVLATILAVMSYLAFIVLLKLQFPVWPAFITG